MILAMLGVWYNNFFGAQTHGLFPYDQVSPSRFGAVMDVEKQHRGQKYCACANEPAKLAARL